MAQRTEQQRNRIRRATSEAMKRIAERDQCPKCGRKSAMTKQVVEEFTLKPIGWQCRWCKHTHLFGGTNEHGE